MAVNFHNPYELTERKLGILKGLNQGLRNKAIAQKLHLSEGTIRRDQSALFPLCHFIHIHFILLFHSTKDRCQYRTRYIMPDAKNSTWNCC
ncbi:MULTISPECIES: LuxR C-terminal-related transcriptional regulator [Brevibacillus]|uniref:LuxR C-terminal-related transcriptional regulator n=1 Tax=Brevibacillus TaxID=55080 RepID=UPI002E260EB8